MLLIWLVVVMVMKFLTNLIIKPSVTIFADNNQWINVILAKNQYY